MLTDYLYDEEAEQFADLHESFHSILRLHQQVLRLHYEEHYDYDEIGEFYGIKWWEAKKRVDRAVYALTSRVNRTESDELYEASRGQWDTRSRGRKAISNAHARKITNGAWGG